jgi:hypothetical protein
MYQLGLQAAVTFMRCRDEGNLLQLLDSKPSDVDRRWAVHAALSSMKYHQLALDSERDVRMPKILSQSDFISKLRSGIALEALERFAFLTRITRLVESAVQVILSGTPNSVCEETSILKGLILFVLP